MAHLMQNAETSQTLITVRHPYRFITVCMNMDNNEGEVMVKLKLLASGSGYFLLFMGVCLKVRVQSGAHPLTFWLL